MIEKIVIFLIALLISAGIALWQKIKAWRHPGEQPDDDAAPIPPHKPLVIAQGVAATFIVDKPSTLPGSKQYTEVRHAATAYPETRQGAEDFLTAMAKERNGSWVSTALVGVAADDKDRASRNEAISLMTPMEEVQLYSKAEDIDEDCEEDDETGEVILSKSDKTWISVEFIGDRIGFLEPKLAAEIFQAKQQDSTRMLSFVLDITGTTEEDRGIEIGILRWIEDSKTDPT